jgi:methylated-DNA-[protein]-cysteine S-methyltransferase
MTTGTAPPNPFDDAAELFGAPPADPGHLARLHEQLVARAADDGLLDVAYRTTDSPYGPLLLAATDGGLVRVAFATEDHDAVLDRLAHDVSPRILRTGRRLDPVARQLDEYFAGTRRTFDVTIDLRLARGFRREVLDHLAAVPYGTTQSYGALAAAAGKPKAVRAAASACSHNPIPLVVPCHRIVRSDGAIGQYLGGTETKRSLLAMEAAA